MYSFTVLAARSLEPRCWQGRAFCSLRGGSFLASSQLLVVVSDTWYSVACRCIILISASMFKRCLSLWVLYLHIVFSSLSPVYLKFPHLIRILVIGLGPNLIQDDFILTWLHLQRPYFQIKSHSPKLGLQHIILWNTTLHSTVCWIKMQIPAPQELLFPWILILRVMAGV